MVNCTRFNEHIKPRTLTPIGFHFTGFPTFSLQFLPISEFLFFSVDLGSLICTLEVPSRPARESLAVGGRNNRVES